MKFNTLNLKTMNQEVVPIVRPDYDLMFTLEPVYNLEEYRELQEKAEAAALESAEKKPPVVRAFIPGQGEVPVEKPRDNSTFMDYVVVKSMVSYSVVKEVEVEREIPQEGAEPLMVKELEKQIVESGPLMWETVKLDDLSTYKEWRNELTTSAKLTEIECNRLQMVAFELNNMSQATLQRAREDFLRLVAAEEQTKV